MREIVFLQRNKEKWEKLEKGILNRNNSDPDELAQMYIEITDDLSFARTFYPKSKTTNYLNKLTSQIYSKIYKNKRESLKRVKKFWVFELPLESYLTRKELMYSFIIFTVSILIGVLSTSGDQNFVRLILGDGYVNMTIENIKKGDPMAVYKSSEESFMFMYITLNNIRVSFMAYVFGLFFSVGTGFLLFYNGVMLGSFQSFFYQYGLFWESFRVVWIHGTLEIAAIIIAGACGLLLGNSFLFPGTYTRLHSFTKGAVRSVKIIIGIVPQFIIAGFLESYITRHTEMPYWLSFLIIFVSLTFVLWYFVYYPYKLNRSLQDGGN